ncbi:MAG: response regulator [Blastocatellia bacterium]|nr:response regulator [Blastocatellia bacterium]
MTKILVIEDEQAIREVIAELLEFDNFEPILAENGQIGLELARQNHPDLILCDINMPVLGGLGVLAAVREDPALIGIPFIFLTAKVDQSDVRMGMELGADDYLFKPIARTELLGAINTQLDKHQMVKRRYEQKLEDLRRNLSTALPHELRTPLNGILGTSDLILECFNSLDREELLELVQNINVSARRLHRLVENFWMYAKIEISSSDQNRMESLGLSKTHSSQGVIEQAAFKLGRSVDRRADIHLDLQECGVFISETYLDKIITELLDNALKYSEPNQKVNIRSWFDEMYLHVVISGISRGMTLQQIADVGAYMQFDRGVYEQQGAGLGLTISKRLAEMHGGELTITSIPGGETSVEITLRRMP